MKHALMVISVVLVGLTWPRLVVGQNATIVQNAVQVGVSSTPVLAARPLRVFLILENISDTDIYCKLNGTAAVNRTGTLLYKDGGKQWWDIPPTVPRNAITCIHAGVGLKELLYTEQY